MKNFVFVFCLLFPLIGWCRILEIPVDPFVEQVSENICNDGFCDDVDVADSFVPDTDTSVPAAPTALQKNLAWAHECPVGLITDIDVVAGDSNQPGGSASLAWDDTGNGYIGLFGTPGDYAGAQRVVGSGSTSFGVNATTC